MCGEASAVRMDGDIAIAIANDGHDGVIDWTTALVLQNLHYKASMIGEHSQKECCIQKA
jgi:hypothetical protein